VNGPRYGRRQRERLAYSSYFPDFALEDFDCAVSALKPKYPSKPPKISARINNGADLGAMPENVSENMRPKTAAGFANEVDEVKK
jgi:hypothetical protein